MRKIENRAQEGDAHRSERRQHDPAHRGHRHRNHQSEREELDFARRSHRHRVHWRDYPLADHSARREDAAHRREDPTSASFFRSARNSEIHGGQFNITRGNYKNVTIVRPSVYTFK